jgi:uncharacterized protein (TIGR02246 family)
MRHRLIPVLVLLLIVTACAPAPEPEPVAEPEAAPMDDAAAIDAIRMAYMEAYNAGDAAGVAALFTSENAWYLPADGSANDGDGIEAAIAASLATGSPMATIETADTVVMGDYAVSRGNWMVEMTPEGADPMSFGGNYMSSYLKAEGDWKINVLLTNYDAPPVEGMPAAPAPERTMPEMAGGAMAGLLASYVDHYNQGHGDVVAGMYGPDAVSAFADTPTATGRDAVAAYFAGSMVEGGELAIHQVGEIDLGDGWYLGGGWFQLTMPDGGREGHWMTVASTDAEGNMMIQWGITNAVHGGM